MSFFAKYCINSVMVIEELISEMSHAKLLWTLAIGIVSFFFRSWIKKALKFLKSLMDSGAFTSIKEAFIETRMMQFMFGSIPENPELKRQVWNKFCEWQLGDSVEIFWQNCVALKEQLLMSANAQGFCVHQNQWLLTFSVFVAELQQEIAKCKARGYDLGDWETKFQLIVQHAEQWVECQFVSGSEAICALRQQVTSMPLQKIDHVMSLMRSPLKQSQDQQAQTCQLLEDVVAAVTDQTAVLREGLAIMKTADQNRVFEALRGDKPSSSALD